MCGDHHITIEARQTNIQCHHRITLFLPSSSTDEYSSSSFFLLLNIVFLSSVNVIFFELWILHLLLLIYHRISCSCCCFFFSCYSPRSCLSRSLTLYLSLAYSPCVLFCAVFRCVSARRLVRRARNIRKWARSGNVHAIFVHIFAIKKVKEKNASTMCIDQ